VLCCIQADYIISLAVNTGEHFQGVKMLRGISIGDISIDCGDPARTREFYARLTGWSACELYGYPALIGDKGLPILFMGCDFPYVPPIWPEEEGKQQKQMHFNFGVDDLNAAVAEALELGAIKAAAQYGGENYATLLDPEGHPFCLCKKDGITPADQYHNDHVREMYLDKDTLSVRMRFHHKYSTNQYGWSNWLFDQYDFHENDKILEAGCGNGWHWRGKTDKLPGAMQAILTDLFPLMLEKARDSEQGDARFTFACMDIQHIPFADGTFDAVIANHMLYHVPDRPQALAEVRRVLKPGGVFYAATMGENNMREMDEIFCEFEERYGRAVRFTHPAKVPFQLQNGGGLLRGFFDSVETREYMDSFVITDPCALFEYISSMNIVPKEWEPKLMEIIKLRFDNEGIMRISKEQGLFVCR